MRIEEHIKRLKESLKLIEESIEKGVMERQRTFGFNTSAASADIADQLNLSVTFNCFANSKPTKINLRTNLVYYMLEIFLHKKSLIDPGFVVKHEWLKSKNIIEDKFPFDFFRKKEIFELILKIEEKRNVLCYGTSQKEEVIGEVLDNFNKLKNIFKEEVLDEIE